jgi:hypothetical protein
VIINHQTVGLTVPPTLLAYRRRGDRVKRRKFITLLGGAAGHLTRQVCKTWGRNALA